MNEGGDPSDKRPDRFFVSPEQPRFGVSCSVEGANLSGLSWLTKESLIPNPIDHLYFENLKIAENDAGSAILMSSK